MQSAKLSFVMYANPVFIKFAQHNGRANYVNQKLNVRKFFGVTFFEKKVTKILTQTN